MKETRQIMESASPRSENSRGTHGPGQRKITVVIPIVGVADHEGLRAMGGLGTDITIRQLQSGPTTIESAYDAVLAAPGIVEIAREAQANGADAVVIDCMDDPGLAAARECVKIPILGPAQTSMHLASMLGHRFSIMTTEERSVPTVENLARLYGLSEMLASVGWITIPVADLGDDRNQVADALIERSVEAVRRDGAHVIVFGCTLMSGHAGVVIKGLEQAGYYGVPVIDPMPATIRITEAVVDLGLSHSQRTY